MKNIIFSLLLLGIGTTVVGQSNYKEASNSLARYMQSSDVKHLESAKKFIDAGYKTRRDSSNSRNNVLRAMIYSSLAYADSTRKIKSDKDPILVAKEAEARIRPRDRERHETEINYIHQNLIAAYIYKANKEIVEKKYADAYQSYLEVEKLGTNTEDVIYNLALLASQAGKTKEAISYYSKLIKDTEADANKYLELAELYKKNKEEQQYLSILETARTKFPQNKQILFQLIEIYNANKSYGAITPMVDEAIAYEPDNIDLIYLAGYANENTGNMGQAKKYYQRIIQLDSNNYSANLALGLIFLNDFLKNINNLEDQYSAQSYLLKANEIKPYDIGALKGLALYYKTVGDDSQLDRVNLLLNQLSNN